MKKVSIYVILSVSLVLTACSMLGGGKGTGVNLFTVEQDKQFGADVAAEIDGNPTEYPLLDSVQYKEVYQYIYNVRDKILNSGQVLHKDDFTWRLRVINDDKTMNAFCTPGGYIYIYTGILKFLDSEDEFAGVLAHEIGHADMRHSTRQMTKMYGTQVLLDVLAGDKAMLKQLTTGLINLKFSRSHESEADQKSVDYLCPTDYKADGGAGFFEKIQAIGGSQTPEFLSTHPDPGNRIEHFHSAAIASGCQGRNSYATEFKAMVSKLP